MKRVFQGFVALSTAALVACTGAHGSTTGSSGAGTTGGSSAGNTSGTSSSSGSSTSNGDAGSYGYGDDPDGGNAYPDGGFPPLACYPPPGYRGNADGIGTYCETDSDCGPGNRCGTATEIPSWKFCVDLGVCDPYDGGSSLIQCGPGACCVPYEGQDVCAPTNCVIDMLADGGGCPDP